MDMKPQLTKGTITHVNETAVTVSIAGRLGIITVPLRWVFTDKAPEQGQTVEFYFSYMNVL